MRTHKPIDLQANIQFLIARAEALSLEDLDDKHWATRDLIQEYRIWMHPSSSYDNVSEYDPNGEFILGLLSTTTPNRKLAELKHRFKASWNPGCLPKSIEIMGSYLNIDKVIIMDLGGTPAPEQILSYKQSLFKTFLRDTAQKIADKKFFGILRDISKTLGYSHFEYYALMSNFLTDQQIELVEGLDKFISINMAFRCISAGLAIPFMAIYAWKSPSPLIPFLQHVTLAISFYDFVYGLKQSPYNAPATVLSVAVTSCATGFLAFQNNHSKDLQLIIIGIGLSKAVFDICSDTLLEKLTAPPAEQTR